MDDVLPRELVSLILSFLPLFPDVIPECLALSRTFYALIVGSPFLTETVVLDEDRNQPADRCLALLARLACPIQALSFESGARVTAPLFDAFVATHPTLSSSLTSLSFSADCLEQKQTHPRWTGQSTRSQSQEQNDGSESAPSHLPLESLQHIVQHLGGSLASLSIESVLCEDAISRDLSLYQFDPAFRLHSLASLSLTHCADLSDISVSQLLVLCPPTLASVSLFGCPKVSDFVLKTIPIACPAVDHVVVGVPPPLSSGKITDRGVHALVAGLISIRAVQVHNCPRVTDISLSSLLRRHATTIESVVFAGCERISTISLSDTRRGEPLACPPSALNLTATGYRPPGTACPDGSAELQLVCPSLLKLELSSTLMKDDVLMSLACSLHAPLLKEFRVFGCGSITDFGASCVVDAFGQSIEILDFDQCSTSDCLVEKVARCCPCLAALLAGCSRNLPVARTVAASTTLSTVVSLDGLLGPRLSVLWLRGAVVDAADIATLLHRCPHLRSLCLDSSRASLSFGEGQHLSSRFPHVCPALHELYLNSVQDLGIREAFFLLSRFPNLVKLQLSLNKFVDWSLFVQIAVCCHHMRSVCLRCCPRFGCPLAEAPTGESPRYMHDAAETAAAADALLQMPLLEELREVDLQGVDLLRMEMVQILLLRAPRVFIHLDRFEDDASTDR